MLGKNRIKKFVALLTAVAVWSVTSMVALAAPNTVSGEITVTGQVTVNGQTAVSNSTITSGSVIVTGANSSAVVSLGKIGRVEIFADSDFTLKFNENSITGILSQGKAQISNSAGITTSIATRNATVIADAGRANVFSVEMGCADAQDGCAQTYVDTISGLVTLRSANGDKQVSAGTSAVGGNISQTGCKPCVRQGGGGKVSTLGLGAGAIAAILIGAGAGIGAAILLGNDREITIGGGTTVVSPVR